MIKTFRGILADGAQERIRLNTKDGRVGYKVIKFDIISATPSANIEHLVQLWKAQQDSVTAAIDFTNSSWLATAWESGGGYSRPENAHVITDREQIVNQDIFISHYESVGSAACNYYIELETIPLSKKAAEYTTVKDLRGYIKVNPFH